MRTSVVVPLFAVLFCTASVASAQTAGPGPSASQDSPTQEEIRRLYLEAKEAGNRDDWATAYKLMQEAWEKRKAADIAVNLAFIEMQLGKWRDAAEHLEFGIKLFPADGDVKHLQTDLERLARCKQEVVTLRIHVEPDAAEVFLGPVSLGVASTLPREVYVEPGAVEISAEIRGRKRAVERFSAKKGEARDVHLALPAASAVPSTVATDIGATPANANAPPRPDSHEPFEWWPAIIGGALTVTAAGVAVGFRVDGNTASGKADELRDGLVRDFGEGACASPPAAAASQCAELQDVRSHEERSNRASNILIISALGIGAATAVVQTFALTVNTDEHAMVLPVVTGQSAGVVLSRRF